MAGEQGTSASSCPPPVLEATALIRRRATVLPSLPRSRASAHSARVTCLGLHAQGCALSPRHLFLSLLKNRGPMS